MVFLMVRFVSAALAMSDSLRLGVRNIFSLLKRLSIFEHSCESVQVAVGGREV